jgi:hypothetical protein
MVALVYGWEELDSLLSLSLMYLLGSNMFSPIFYFYLLLVVDSYSKKWL